MKRKILKVANKLQKASKVHLKISKNFQSWSCGFFNIDITMILRYAFKRKMIDKNFDRIISRRSKYGYSDNLWKNSNVFKELRINDQIGDSNFFSNENFNKNIKTYLLSDKCPRGIKWSSLALQNTYEKMKTIRKDSQALLS